MIIREWRGYAKPDRGDDYPRHFRSAVMPELGSLPGFLGAHLSCRLLEGEIEFVVLTRWRSWEAIHAFAGEDIGCAVVEPGAKAALSRFDQTVQHYEVLEEVVV